MKNGKIFTGFTQNKKLEKLQINSIIIYEVYKDMSKIVVIPGDGIGKEITDSAVEVLKKVDEKFNMLFN